MGPLASVIEAAGVGDLEAEVFGTTDPRTVAEVMSSIAGATTDRRVNAALWHRSSVAAVAGVVLDDGGEVVVRAYRPSTSSAFIEGVVRVQGHLADAGFVCATPLGEPTLVAGVLGRAESMLADPGPRRFASSEMTTDFSRFSADLTARPRAEGSPRAWSARSSRSLGSPEDVHPPMGTDGVDAVPALTGPDATQRDSLESLIAHSRRRLGVRVPQRHPSSNGQP
ncbi:MAG: hypothetical protein U5R31_13410 [Acidimicrobiia bacterium]|nr:hypothetical protein [Acidimicrobiia bacterium]